MKARRTRGLTLTEVLVALTISGLVATLLVALIRFTNILWWQGGAEESTKQTLALAVGKMEPQVRGALRVNVAQSSASRLTVVLPRINAATGGYVVPRADGDVVSFYLSNRTGSPTATGTILWRSVNGTPDAGWSLRAGRGAVDLGTGALTFAYLPTNAPRGVRITVTANQSSGRRTLARTAATEVVLRNARDGENGGIW